MKVKKEELYRHINALRYISHLAHKALPSSKYLRYDSKFYSKEKVELYELCQFIIGICNLPSLSEEGDK